MEKVKILSYRIMQAILFITFYVCQKYRLVVFGSSVENRPKNIRLGTEERYEHLYFFET